MFNRAEARIHYLYQFLEKRVMPWQWDFNNYWGEPRKESMIGFFYPEDIENIKQIEKYKITGHNRQATAAKSK
jgi:hypothetical protein